MKIRLIPALITLTIAALLAFLFYTMSNADEQMHKALAISGFISTAICLECGIGLSYKDSCYKANTFATSLFFLVLLIVEHCCFAAWGKNPAWVIITSGLLVAVFLLILFGIIKAKM